MIQEGNEGGEVIRWFSPYAGITRFRFLGYDLSLERHP